MASSPFSAQNLFNVNGLVAVVTGGGAGLGLTAANALDANGAKAVYIVGRREEVLKQAAANAKNGSLIPVPADVSDKEALTAVADRIRKEHGYLNLVIANAGITGVKVAPLLPQKEGKPTVKEFQEAMLGPSMEEFSKVFDLNITATFYTALAFLDLLEAGNQKGNVPQSSQIIATASVAGFSRALLMGFGYSVSKAAVLHLVKMMSSYFGDYKIRCNALCPGIFPSDMTSSVVNAHGELPENVHGAFKDARYLPKEFCSAERTGSQEDLAAAILFLSSRGGAYVDGETLVLDGGRLSKMPSSY